MTAFQSVFNRYHQKGQPGQLARANAPHDQDVGVTGVETKPGYGMYYDAGTNKFILPTSDATRKLVTHVVGYGVASPNVDIANPAGNNLTEVIFAVNSIITLACFGSFYVIAGETVENGDAAIFNQTTGRWIKYAPAAPTANDLRTVPFVFYADPLKTVADGGIVEIKIPSRNYAFTSLSALPVQTDRIELTAAQIKTLRATPQELVPTPGAGKALEFVSIMMKLVAGTEILSESTDNLVVNYTDGAGVSVSDTIETTGFIDQAADTQTNGRPVKDNIVVSTGSENQPFVLFNSGNAEIAGNASDDAVLIIHTTFRTHTA